MKFPFTVTFGVFLLTGTAWGAGAFKDGHQVDITLTPSAGDVASGTKVTVIATCRCGEPAAAPKTHDLKWDRDSSVLTTTVQKSPSTILMSGQVSAGTYKFSAVCGGATDSALLSVRERREFQSDGSLVYGEWNGSHKINKIFVGDRITLFYRIDRDPDQYKTLPDGAWQTTERYDNNGRLTDKNLGNYKFTLTIEGGRASFNPQAMERKKTATGTSSGIVYVYVLGPGNFKVHLNLSDETKVTSPDEGSRATSKRRVGETEEEAHLRDDILHIESGFTRALHIPETLTLLDGDATTFENAEPSATYIYKCGPRPAPEYEGILVDEVFGPITAYQMTDDDIDEEWKKAHPRLSQDINSILNHIYEKGGGKGANTSFRLDAANEFKDTHSGGGWLAAYPIIPREDIGFTQHQNYKCGGRIFPLYQIHRAIKDNSIVIWKEHGQGNNP